VHIIPPKAFVMGYDPRYLLTSGFGTYLNGPFTLIIINRLNNTNKPREIERIFLTHVFLLKYKANKKT